MVIWVPEQLEPSAGQGRGPILGKYTLYLSSSAPRPHSCPFGGRSSSCVNLAEAWKERNLETRGRKRAGRACAARNQQAPGKPGNGGLASLRPGRGATRRDYGLTSRIQGTRHRTRGRHGGRSGLGRRGAPPGWGAESGPRGVSCPVHRPARPRDPERRQGHTSPHPGDVEGGTGRKELQRSGMTEGPVT